MEERRKPDENIVHLLRQTQAVQSSVDALKERMDAFIRWSERHEDKTHTTIDLRLASHSKKINWAYAAFAGVCACAGFFAWLLRR